MNKPRVINGVTNWDHIKPSKPFNGLKSNSHTLQYLDEARIKYQYSIITDNQYNNWLLCKHGLCEVQSCDTEYECYYGSNYEI